MPILVPHVVSVTYFSFSDNEHKVFVKTTTKKKNNYIPILKTYSIFVRPEEAGSLLGRCWGGWSLCPDGSRSRPRSLARGGSTGSLEWDENKTWDQPQALEYIKRWWLISSVLIKKQNSKSCMNRLQPSLKQTEPNTAKLLKRVTIMSVPVLVVLESQSLLFPRVGPAPSCLWSDVRWAGFLRCGPGTEGLQHGRWRKLPGCPLCPGACQLWSAMTACKDKTEESPFGVSCISKFS